ncbi:FAD-dependent monooxygenase andE [Paramyrothecium foliicola]|nr:FAD-dependent monooxygenase andE [Paramyrothecium foliicola]
MYILLIFIRIPCLCIMSDKPFRVIIVGGSVAGLSLANMLEQARIDYVVLEAYNDIAPQVGASIGIQANGMRILDQLGCFEALHSISDKTSKRHVFRNSDGSPLFIAEDVNQRLIRRHGYDFIFIDRQMLLQVLYENLKDRSKILTGCRVTKVIESKSSVKVMASDGRQFTGDIIVGADGIHSTIRKEMGRIAADAALPNFSSEEDEHHSIINHHFSYLILWGPAGRVYWFLFVKLPQTLFGKDIPKYSKADEAKLAQEHSDDSITESVKFGDLYNCRISSTLVPLQEHIFSTWHSQRIITLGDAAHKVNPIAGHGGNSAIESTATLVNRLVQKLTEREKRLSDKEITEVFAEVQAIRKDRVTDLMRRSNREQIIEAQETTLLSLVAQYAIPQLGQENSLDRFSDAIVGAAKLEVTPVPERARIIPFNDELPAKAWRHVWPLRVTIAVFLIGVYYVSTVALSQLSLPSTFHGTELKRSFTGMTQIDDLLSMLVSAFGIGLDPSDASNASQRVHLQYFMVQLIAPTLTWIIDGYRQGSSSSLAAWYVQINDARSCRTDTEFYRPLPFMILYQLHGIGKIAPLYYLVKILSFARKSSLGVIERSIPLHVAKSILPAVCVGYVIPTYLMLIGSDDMPTWQNYVALWQPFPIYVSALTLVLSTVVRTTQARRSESSERAWRMAYERQDLPYLKTTYLVSFAALSTLHLAYVSQIWSSPNLSIYRVFGDMPWPSGVSQINDMSTQFFAFLKYDMLLYVAATIIYLLGLVFETRALGFATSSQARNMFVLSLIGILVVGPGATEIALVYWLEDTVWALAKS